ncbi:MAG: DUF4870 domain-containing protein [Verrucomicrobia bacterium]|nr:DUF4870 domain-containing protein [Verrucomicrobiota bacterium]
METVTSSVSSSSVPAGNDKLWAVLCHLSGFLGVALLLPLIVYLVMKDESAYVRANAREALNFHLSLLIYALVCLPLIVVIIGIPLLIVLGIASFIFAIIAAIKASDGECYRYPCAIPFIRPRLAGSV